MSFILHLILRTRKRMIQLDWDRVSNLFKFVCYSKEREREKGRETNITLSHKNTQLINSWHQTPPNKCGFIWISWIAFKVHSVRYRWKMKIPFFESLVSSNSTIMIVSCVSNINRDAINRAKIAAFDIQIRHIMCLIVFIHFWIRERLSWTNNNRM